MKIKKNKNTLKTLAHLNDQTIPPLKILLLYITNSVTRNTFWLGIALKFCTLQVKQI